MSLPGTGTRVPYPPEVLFSSLLSSVRPDALAAGELPSKELRKPVVLVVDDEGLIADSIVEILSDHGYEAKAAYSGEAAVQMAGKLRPDLLLTDVLMPRVNGIETALRVQQASERTRILLFSGQAGATDLLRKAQDSGIKFELLPKPIHPQQLLRALAGMLQN